jgi:hypothetical protein
MIGAQDHTKIENEVRCIPYAIWEKEGRPHGRDIEHWLMAESAVQGREPGSRPEPGANPLAVSKKTEKTAGAAVKRKSASKTTAKKSTARKSTSSNQVKA